MPIVPQMRERLLVNRSGKLTSSQWLDIVMQPLTTILLLVFPVTIFFLPRLMFMMARGGWMILLGIAVLIVASFVFRAYRYARAPVYFARLHANSDSPPFWMFWKPIVLYDEKGEALRFSKRLAPRPIIQRDHDYIVYYLRDPQDNVLLSIAPADHNNVEQWKPDGIFEARFKQRRG